jgi:hypothetical protein
MGCASSRPAATGGPASTDPGMPNHRTGLSQVSAEATASEEAAEAVMEAVQNAARAAEEEAAAAVELASVEADATEAVGDGTAAVEDDAHVEKAAKMAAETAAKAEADAKEAAEKAAVEALVEVLVDAEVDSVAKAADEAYWRSGSLDWKARLSKEEHQILREKKTEAEGSGEYDRFQPPDGARKTM